MSDRGWQAIFDVYDIHSHDFNSAPYYLSSSEIKEATKGFTETRDREVRLLCKHDTRESRPQLFKDNDLFILPVRNGHYAIIRGEGYVDIPPVPEKAQTYISELDFHLDTAFVGNSEMQHVDYAYAASLIRSVMDDESLVLTIRGRKYTPEINFRVGEHEIETRSVQTEVDAGYEGRCQVVLIEAKNASTSNTIIRQLFYPYRQWKEHTDKPISTVFFERQGKEYNIWQFVFDDDYDYNSIRLLNSGRYIIGTDE